VLLVVALAAILPLAVTVALRPAMYNGIRHFIFVVPPLAVLGGLAGAKVFEAVRPSWPAAIFAVVILAAGIAPPISEMAKLHPYEYTYFNWASGGVAHARDRYMLDYWGLSLKQASQALLSQIAQRRETKPADRRWKVAVCGPHRSPQVELGPDFDISWEPMGADYAITLGEFYC